MKNLHIFAFSAHCDHTLSQSWTTTKHMDSTKAGSVKLAINTLQAKDVESVG
jgi:hypothetical protein